MTPSVRKLRVYASNPLVEAFADPVTTVEVPWETLAPGPRGERVEVIDYDSVRNCFYTPVNLDDPALLAQDGLDPTEADPRFHQQMVYAISMATHGQFELALGRGVGMAGSHGPRAVRTRRSLRIFPHGTREANAYYSPDDRAIIFGYFPASRKDCGRNLPGGTVFTCLSHDIVAHETTHALVDALRPKFLEPTGRDVYAFHEAFADLVAILQRFTFPRFLEEAIEQTRGQLDEVTPLFELGRQFGEAIGQRKALRSHIGCKPDPAALQRTTEPHNRGAILVAAIFNALTAIYRHRTGDLIRLAAGGRGELPKGSLAPDLVKRLAREARKTAKHFLNICIRALDYCPPVDITFGDYLRALITADRDLVGEDPHGYRAAIIAAFRDYGIYPEKVQSLAEGSLLWHAPAGTPDHSGCQWSEIRFDRSPQQVPETQRQNYYTLFHKFLTKKKNRLLFGLQAEGPVQVASVQPLRRVAPNGRIQNEVVVQALQQGDAVLPVKGSPVYWGGCTLIVRENDGIEGGCEVRYCIHKRLKNPARHEQHKEYLQELIGLSLTRDGAKGFALPTLRNIHRGW